VTLLTVLLGGATFPGYSHTHLSSSASLVPLSSVINNTYSLRRISTSRRVSFAYLSLVHLRLLPRSRLSLDLLVLPSSHWAILQRPSFHKGPCQAIEPSVSQPVQYLWYDWLLAPLSLFSTEPLNARHWSGGSHLTTLGFVATVTTFYRLSRLVGVTYVGLAQRTIEARC
jgi:hypothetical protein